MNKEYIELLISRMKYFQDKKITELTDSEIREYLALKEEIQEVFPVVKETVKKVWEAMREYVEPYVKAEIKYQERVLNRE